MAKILNGIGSIGRSIVSKVLNDIKSRETTLLHGVSSTKLLKRLIGKECRNSTTRV